MTFAEVQVLIEENRELLRGPKGVKGDRGEPGRDGTRGETGPIGRAGKSITGPPGKDGRDGKDGVDGKSVTGPAGKAGPAGKDGVGPDERVRVSADDPKAGFLADKLTAGSGIEIRTASGKRGERLVIDATSQGGGGGQSGIIAYDDGVAVGAGNKVSFDGGDPVTISGGLIHVPVGSGAGADDQTAAEVPFTPAGTISATNVQAAIEEVAAEAGSGDFIPQGGPLTADLDTATFAITTSSEGDQVNIRAVDVTTGSGGGVLIRGGAAADFNEGAQVFVVGGVDGTSGGSATVEGGGGIAGLPGGSVRLRGGQGDDGNDERAYFQANGGDGAGNAGRVEIQTDNSTGSLGDVLTAQGDDTALWVAPSGLPGSPETYTETNVVTDRAFDATSLTLNEMAHVLGSLISDLRSRGVVA